MEQKTRNKISYLNFLLSLFIIWHHTYNIEVYGIDKGFLYYLELVLLNLFEAAVPLFFLLSSFLFYYNLKDNLSNKLKSRFFTLVIPYLVWNLLGYFYFQAVSLFPFVAGNYSGSIEAFSLFGMIKQTLIGDYNLVTWFLRILILYTFTFPFLYRLFRNKTASWLLLSLTFAINLLTFKNRFTVTLCFYCLGIHIAMNYKDLFLREYSKKGIYVSVFVLLLTLLVYTFTDTYYYSLTGRLLYVVIIFCIWIIADLFRTEIKPQWWMKQNLIYYCGHEMVLEPVEKIIYLLLGNSVFGAVVDYVFAPIICVFLIIAVSSLFKKIKPFYNLLNGFRQN